MTQTTDTGMIMIDAPEGGLMCMCGDRCCTGHDADVRDADVLCPDCGNEHCVCNEDCEYCDRPMRWCKCGTIVHCDVCGREMPWSTTCEYIAQCSRPDCVEFALEQEIKERGHAFAMPEADEMGYDSYYNMH